MTYLRDNEKRKKRNIIILLSVAVFFLIYNQHKITSLFSGGVSDAARPALNKVSVIKDGVSGGILSVFSFKTSLIAENNSLRRKLDESDARLADYSHLLSENLELKALLGRQEHRKFLLAAILAKPNQSPYDTLLLDVGVSDGVFAGAEVLAYGNIVIGRIGEAADNTSKAILFSSPGEEYDGTISGKNISLKLSGQGGGNFTAKLPRSVPIAQGDQAYSTGLTQHLLGTVQNISSDPRDPFKNILFKSPVNIAELRFVEIVL